MQKFEDTVDRYHGIDLSRKFSFSSQNPDLGLNQSCEFKKVCNIDFFTYQKSIYNCAKNGNWKQNPDAVNDTTKHPHSWCINDFHIG